MTVVWANGRLVAPDEPAISALDHGVTVGDGVFETLKVVGGRPFAMTRHLDRLERSAAGLGLQSLLISFPSGTLQIQSPS